MTKALYISMESHYDPTTAVGTKEQKMSNKEKEIKDLLDQAMQQPGVADIVKTYELQQDALNAFSEAQGATEPKWVAFASTSSTFVRT